jgi:hypothetical protein
MPPRSKLPSRASRERRARWGLKSSRSANASSDSAANPPFAEGFLFGFGTSLPLHVVNRTPLFESKVPGRRPHSTHLGASMADFAFGFEGMRNRFAEGQFPLTCCRSWRTWEHTLRTSGSRRPPFVDFAIRIIIRDSRNQSRFYFHSIDF